MLLVVLCSLALAAANAERATLSCSASLDALIMSVYAECDAPHGNSASGTVLQTVTVPVGGCGYVVDANGPASNPGNPSGSTSKFVGCSTFTKSDGTTGTSANIQRFDNSNDCTGTVAWDYNFDVGPGCGVGADSCGCCEFLLRLNPLLLPVVLPFSSYLSDADRGREFGSHVNRRNLVCARSRIPSSSSSSCLSLRKRGNHRRRDGWRHRRRLLRAGAHVPPLDGQRVRPEVPVALCRFVREAGRRRGDDGHERQVGCRRRLRVCHLRESGVYPHGRPRRKNPGSCCGCGEGRVWEVNEPCLARAGEDYVRLCRT